MQRDEWKDLDEPWKRVLWARIRWQTKATGVKGTAKDAAISLGMEPGTYRAYERAPDTSKHTELDHQAAIQFARKFKVSWKWLLLGEGTPDDDQLPEPQERVIRVMSTLDEERQKEIADAIETLLAGSARTGTDG